MKKNQGQHRKKQKRCYRKGRKKDRNRATNAEVEKVLSKNGDRE